jgi:tetratricopeptide (TPR) repeat protein
MKLRLFFALAFCSTVATAAQPIPDAGLRAEMQGQWADAVEIYTQTLEANPAQAHLWERIADIRATQLKTPARAAEALREAVKYAPTDARLHYKLSQAYAAAQDGAGALKALNRAIELDPGNPIFLRARGDVATWTGDYALALESFERVLSIAPGDADARLGAARAASRGGQKDAAGAHYRAYLTQRPQDKDVMLEAMEFEAERGNTQTVQDYDAIYRQRFGESKEYWLRMADIYALGNDSAASSAALQEAARLAPDDHALFNRLAQSYPSEKDARKAAAAIERAVELDPKNVEYLRTRADLASWRGDYAMALDSYQRILLLAPNDSGARLGIARVKYWQSQLDDSKLAYQDYLAQQPNVAAAWMEYIVVLTELGDYPLAVEVLEDYRQRFGDNVAYRKQKARVLAWAARPTPALALADELAPSLRDDYELGYTRTVALHHDRRPQEALDSLAEVTRLRPDSKDTADLTRFIRTPLRSSVTAGFAYQTDSDDVTIRRVGVAGQYVINPQTRVFGGADQQRIHADVGSGYEKPDGGTEIDYERAWLGIRHRLSSTWAFDAQAGSGWAEGNDSNFVYEIGADFQPADEFAMRLWRRQDLYAVSPRAAALGIERRANVADFSWAPDLRWVVTGRAGYDTFSDDNDRWLAELAPRRAFLRTQRLNLDLGISGQWYGFDRDPGNGYYAPTRYERYALTAYTYWKIDDDNGVSLAFSYGPYKDNAMSGFSNGGDVVAEGYFGIYRDWYLNVKAGYSTYPGSTYPGGATGDYDSRMFELNLTRRF